jgi:hypothetical protein
MPKVRDWEHLEDDADDFRFEKIHRGGHMPEDDVRLKGNKKQNKPKRIPRPDKDGFVDDSIEE